MKTRWNEPFESDVTSSREVAQRFREAIHDDDRDARGITLALLHYRGGEDEFLLGKEYSLSLDADDRATGACILAQLGWGDRTFLDESVAILVALLYDRDPYVISRAAIGLGHRAAKSAIPELLRLIDHVDPQVRNGVTFGLLGHEDDSAIGGLIRLAVDDDRDVKKWAVFGLGSQIEADSLEIREALRRALDDPDNEIRGEALLGLALRGDCSVVERLLDEWSGDYISVLSLEAAEECRDARLYDSLKKFAEDLQPNDDPYYVTRLTSAIEACKPTTEQN
jgi:hypothetical protein